MADEANGADAVRSYEKWLPAAEALDGEALLTLHVDPQAVLQNVRVGVEAVLAIRPLVEAALPTTDWQAIAEAPEVAMAVVVAHALVNRHPRSVGTTAQLRAEAARLRGLLLLQAQLLAAAGALSGDDVHAIEVGKGAVDQARDCVALAALFRREWDAVKARCAVTIEQIDEAAELGSALLRTYGARKAADAPGPGAEAAERRDRLSTLLRDRYDQARRVAAWYWLDDAQRHVPPLQSQTVHRPKKAAEAAPA
jgi:hypothetical protein